MTYEILTFALVMCFVVEKQLLTIYKGNFLDNVYRFSNVEWFPSGFTKVFGSMIISNNLLAACLKDSVSWDEIRFYTENIHALCIFIYFYVVTLWDNPKYKFSNKPSHLEAVPFSKTIEKFRTRSSAFNANIIFRILNSNEHH